MKRRLPAILLGIVFLLSLALNMHGVNWARFAPDEVQIAQWMAALDRGDTLFIRNRVYPEGFFAFAKALRVVDRQWDKVCGHVADWQRQNAERSSRNGADAELAAGARFPIHRLRKINAWLGATSSALVFLTLLAMFGQPLLAFAGAAVFAFHPFLVEHTHYAETDIMMVFMETLALFAMTLALKRRSTWLFLAAAFLTGAAVAAKFSLTPMLLLLPANAVVVGRRRGNGWWSCLALALAAPLLALAGFAAFTPKLWYAPALWLAQYGGIRRSAYGELRGLLDEDAGKPFAATFLRLRFLLRHARACGIACWGAAAVSLPLWLGRGRRATSAGVPLFGAAYLAAAVLTFPWFRSQEFLPALPFLAASAVAPLAAALEIRRRPARLAASAAAIALLAAVLAHTATAGARMSNSFSSVETRLAVADWLDCCARENKAWITEFYVTIASPSRFLRHGDNHLESCSKLERIPPELWDKIGCDYFLVAKNFIGRGNYSPLTGKLFPARKAALDHCMDGAVELNRWSIRDGIEPTFSQTDVVLYANRAATQSEANLRRFLRQPAFVKGKWWGNPTVRISNASGLLGPLEGTHLIGKRTRIEFQPLKPGERWFAVAVNQSGDSPFSAEFDRGFSPRRHEIPPGGAALFVSNDSLLGRWDAVPWTRARIRGDDHASRCTAFFTRDASIAADLLRLHGNKADAASLSPADGDRGCDPALALSLIGGDDDITRLAVNGMPGKAVRDFSKASAGDLLFITPDAPVLAMFRKDFLYADLPFSVCDGECSISLKLKPSRLVSRLISKGGTSNGDFDLIGARLIGIDIGGLDDDMRLEVTIHAKGAGRYLPLYLGIRALDEATVSYEASSINLMWNPAAAIRALAGTTSSPNRADDSL